VLISKEQGETDQRQWKDDQKYQAKNTLWYLSLQDHCFSLVHHRSI